ncbi:hypothetical protein CGCA056_v010212 [Colletotrichum aenigma]|uniref:uncharacterized protein n=1 Tax=Colletotrichum aenigma TaxID=1215731 RepID=UPI0018728944|nr:uncharacterized protein CGCA056_v010212 [Colletotrichum aenigma]KAF5519421.1 hypothetical protein CGCA056_v010212 [Colletotrichum aenigma]
MDRGFDHIFRAGAQDPVLWSGEEDDESDLGPFIYPYTTLDDETVNPVSLHSSDITSTPVLGTDVYPREDLSHQTKQRAGVLHPLRPSLPQEHRAKV